MENVLLIVHLILAIFLIAVVLLQRSEGGALGIGGGGGGGLVSSRGAATALSKVTWGLAGAFIITSLSLTLLAASDSADRSVLDRLEAPAGGAGDATLPLIPGAEDEGGVSPDLERLIGSPPASSDGTPVAPTPPAAQ